MINNFLMKLRDPQTGKLLFNMVELVYPDGGKYIGEVTDDTLTREGLGIFWYPKDDVYMGNWKNDTFHGNGVYFFGSGERYEGQLNMGLKSGRGTYYYNTGSYYSGNWSQDVKEGEGLFEDPVRQ